MKDNEDIFWIRKDMLVSSFNDELRLKINNTAVIFDDWLKLKFVPFEAEGNEDDAVSFPVNGLITDFSGANIYGGKYFSDDYLKIYDKENSIILGASELPTSAEYHVKSGFDISDLRKIKIEHKVWLK
jgi:hypothetical protein